MKTVKLKLHKYPHVVVLWGYGFARQCLAYVPIHTPKTPKKVTLEPANRPLDYDYSLGNITLTLPHLQIHDIIVVE
ncbi:MAG: hypothetical protein ISS70_08325 [Phycisphaerae bacterium]|nr:hypothetical protein [Phycisphaerae bacterium]